MHLERLLQTPSVNGLGHPSALILDFAAVVSTHHRLFSYVHCFNWPVLLLTPLSSTHLMPANHNLLLSLGNVSFTPQPGVRQSLVSVRRTPPPCGPGNRAAVSASCPSRPTSARPGTTVNCWAETLPDRSDGTGEDAGETTSCGRPWAMSAAGWGPKAAVTVHAGPGTGPDSSVTLAGYGITKHGFCLEMVSKLPNVAIYVTGNMLTAFCILPGQYACCPTA